MPRPRRMEGHPSLRSAIFWFLLVMCLISPALAEEEEEKASRMAVAMAGTLLGAISFQMGLLYITNHRDEDIRRYSYDIINSTVSIFAAVLLFQTVNGLVEVYLLEGMSPELQALVDMAHMLTWYVILQLTLAWISGAIGGEPSSMEAMELNLKSLAVLLAHMTGFASINAWGAVQQLSFFRMNSLMSFLVIPISILGQLGLQHITRLIREKVNLADDGELDDYEKKWNEETQECENDVMGLTLSFNFTQAVRFFVCGSLPNQEGAEPFLSLVNHTTTHIVELFMVGLWSAYGMVVIFMITYKTEEKENGSESAKQGEKSQDTESALEAGESEKSEEEEDEFWDRAKDASILTLSMCFAWCTFFSSKMILGRMHFLDDPMLLAMAHTMSISLVAFSSIRVLDVLADADWTPDWVDDAIKQFIKGPLSILVGFGWEQCFDQAVESLASVLPSPHLSKGILAVFCVAIVVPAWKWYLLPMELQDGWEFGFVIDPDTHDDRQEFWEKVMAKVQEKKAEKEKKEEQEKRKSVCLSGQESPRSVKSTTPKAADEDLTCYRPLPGGEDVTEKTPAPAPPARTPATHATNGSTEGASPHEEHLRAAQLERERDSLQERLRELSRQHGEFDDLRKQMDRMANEHARLQKDLRERNARLTEKNAVLTSALASAEEAAVELQGVLRSRKIGRSPGPGTNGPRSPSLTRNGNGRVHAVTE